MEIFPDPVLKTDRLTLRPLRASGAADVVTGASDPVSQQWRPLPRPYPAEQALAFITRPAPGMHATARPSSAPSTTTAPSAA